MPELTPEQRAQLDRNIRMMLNNGASEEDVMKYNNDFKLKYDVQKKREVGGKELVLEAPSTFDPDELRSFVTGTPIEKVKENKLANAKQPAKITNAITQVQSQTPSETSVAEEAERKIANISDDDLTDPVKGINKLSQPNPTNPKDILATEKAKEILVNRMASDGFDAKNVLNRSFFGAAEDNQTSKVLREKAAKYDRSVEPLREIQVEGDLSNADDNYLAYNYKDKVYSAAVQSLAENNPTFRKELEAIGVNPKDYANVRNQIGSGKMGNIMNRYLNDPDVISYLTKENPSLIPVFKHIERNLLNDNKDFAINQVANKVSKAVQETGYNSADPIFNYYGEDHKQFADQVARNTLTPEELNVWNKEIKDNQEKYMDAPSLFQGAAEGGKGVFEGIANTFTEPFRNISESTRNRWEKESSRVSADPKGVSKFMSDTGHVLGLVGAIAGTGNVLGGGGASMYSARVVPALSGGVLPFAGDMLEQGRAKYPDSPAKAWGSALFNTAMYGALSQSLFPAKSINQAIGRIKPEMDNIVERLADGEITREAARQQANTAFKRAWDFTSGTVGTASKITAELTAIKAFDRGLDKVMMDENEFKQFHPEADQTKEAGGLLLSNLALGAFTKFGNMKQRNRLAEESYYEIASNPKKYERAIDNLSIDKSFGTIQELKANLNHIAGVKEQMDALKINPKDQKRFIFESLKERAAKQQAEATEDASIQQKSKEIIKDAKEIKEKILAGADAETIITESQKKEIEEQQDAALKIERLKKDKELSDKKFDEQRSKLDGRIPDDRLKIEELNEKRKRADEDFGIEMEKLSPTPKLPGIYGEMYKSNPEAVLKDIAEQAQGVDSNGNPLVGGSQRKSMIEQGFSEEIIDEAVRKYPAAQPKQDVVPSGSENDVNSGMKLGGEISGYPDKNPSEVEWHHGTTKEFDEFSFDNLTNDLGVFLTSDKNLAQEYTKLTPFTKEENVGMLKSVNVNPKKTYDIRFGRTNEKDVNAVFDALIERAKNLDEEKDSLTPVHQKLEKAKEAILSAKDVNEWKQAEAKMYDLTMDLAKREGGYKFASIAPLKEVLQKLGFDSVRKVDDGADTLVVLDKSIISYKPKQQTTPTKEEGGKNAIQEQGSNEMDVRQQATNGEGVGAGNIQPESTTGKEKESQTTGEEKVGGGEPPKEPPKAKVTIHAERPPTILSHRGLQEVANEFSLPDVKSRDRKSDLQLRQDARETVDNWAEKGEYAKNIERLISEAEKGEILTDKERVILEGHLANVRHELEWMSPSSPEFDAKLHEIRRLKDAGEKTRSEAGAALRIPTGGGSRPKDIADALIEEMDATNSDILTDKQKETVQKEFNDIKKAEQQWKDKFDALKAEHDKLLAEQEIKKTSQKTKSVKKDFKKEREEYREELKKAKEKHEQWLKDQGIQKQGVGGFVLTTDMAKAIGKIAKSYVEEGVTKLAEVVEKTLDDIKDIFGEVTAKDIQDVIAGKYAEKKQTRSELAIRLQDLRTEANLIDKLGKLESGVEPKSEKKKQKRNREITELRKKIKEHDLTKLANKKGSMRREIDKIQEQLKNGDFAPETKKAPVPLDAEALRLKDKLIKLKNERKLRQLRQFYENQSDWEKGVRAAIEIANIPRALMATLDFSALLRQAVIPTISRPRTALRYEKGRFEGSVAEMFRGASSQKLYDRWFEDLSESKRFDDMKKSELGITDSTDPRLQAREEQWMSSLADKIPLVGKTLIKGSERAYSMGLNKIRVDMYNRFADAMEQRGLTVENSPKEYKAMAHYINNATGRGDLGSFFNKSAPVLNALFFSPRLIASRVNMLTYFLQPRFYKTVPKEVRRAYVADMIKFVGIGMTVLALAKLNGADVDTDPRSSDFGKIKAGNTRWDIWGGFQQYARVISQIVSGERKSTNTGQIQELNGEGPFGTDRSDITKSFFRGKLAPIPSMAVDILGGRTVQGDKLTSDWNADENKEVGLGTYLGQHFLPLNATGIYEAIQDQGLKAWFTVGVPSTFGVGIQTYQPSQKSSSKAKKSKPTKPTKND